MSANPSFPSQSGSNLGAPSNTRTFKGFQVPAILTWQNPAETGLLLAETLGLFVVLSSTLTLRYFFKIVSTVIGLLSAAEWISRTISGQRQGLVSTYQPSRFLPLSDKVVNNFATYVSQALSKVTFGIQHLVDSRNPSKGLKLAGSLYVAYLLLGIFSLKTVILSGLILAFSVPSLYLQFKPQVDQTIGDLQTKVEHQLKNTYDQIYAKAGPQIDYLKKFLGPRGGFDKSMDVSPVGTVPTAAAKPTEHTKNAASTHPAASFDHTTTSSTNYGNVSNTGALKGSSVGAENIEPQLSTFKAPTQVPDEVFKNFDSVPTLAGTVPIDHERLTAALAADKAKAEGSVNGL